MINGASGGVGTFAVQIAKVFGAEVTAYAVRSNVDLVRSIGADHVIDYTKEDFTKSDQRYDLIFDNVNNIRSPNAGVFSLLMAFAFWPASAEQACTKVNCPASVESLKHSWRRASRGKSSNMYGTMTKHGGSGLLRDLMAAGKLTPVIDRTYKLSETAEAMRYFEEGHARGKIVITMEETSLGR